MLTTIRHNQIQGKVKTKKWKRREDAQTLKNDHGSFLRALGRGFLAPSKKKIYYYYYEFSESNYNTMNK